MRDEIALIVDDIYDTGRESDDYKTYDFVDQILNLPKLKDYIDKYQELLMAVERKFPNETRHETALRYIREAETVQRGQKAVGCYPHDL